MAQLGIDKESLEKVAHLYDEIRGLFKSKHLETDDVLTQAFQKSISSIITSLQSKLDSSPDTAVISRLEAKYNLWQMCADKLLSYLKSSEIQASTLLSEISQHQQELLAEILSLSQKPLDSSFNSTGNEAVKNSIEQYEKTIESLREDNIRLRTEGASQEILDEIEELRQENSDYLSRIIKLSKDKADNVVPPSPTKSKREIRTVRATGSNKDLSLKQLKDIIEDVYTSKQKRDARLLETKQPRETMAQFLTFYLNQKYGLKPLMNEWYSAILNAVDKYSEDAEVYVFAKILQHCVQESFAVILKEAKKTVHFQLLQIVKNKNPYILEVNAKALANERKNGSLEEEEWEAIAKYMYNAGDAVTLCQALHMQAQAVAVSTRTKSRQKQAPKLSLPFVDVLNTVLHFQVDAYLKMIQPLQLMFAQVDNDADGLINDIEAEELLSKAQLLEVSNRMAELLDPFETGVFVFSDLVEFFLKETTELSGQSVPIIHKLYTSI